MQAIARMSQSDRVAETLRRSLPLLPADARKVVMEMIRPEALAITAAVLAAWVGSHLFGVGEVVDLILLGIGAATLGFTVFEAAGALYDFADKAIGARTDADLDIAASRFAQAVTLLGIGTIDAVLMRGQGGALLARGVPKIHPRVRVPPPPPPNRRPPVTYVQTLGPNVHGATDAYGAIEISRASSAANQQLALLHEKVHSWLSPRTGLLRRLRAELALSGYTRSALLCYLEEALAQVIAMTRMRGLKRGLREWRFPLANGYVTVSKLKAEGQAVGTIVLGTETFWVSLSLGPAPKPAN